MKKVLIGIIVVLLFMPYLICINDISNFNKLDNKQEKLDIELTNTIDKIVANNNIINDSNYYDKSYKDQLKLENIELEKLLNRIELNSEANRRKMTALDYKIIEKKRITLNIVIAMIILILLIVIFLIIKDIKMDQQYAYNAQRNQAYRKQFESKKEEAPKETKDTIYNQKNNTESNIKQEPKIDIVWTSPTTYQQKPKEEQKKESTYKSKSLLSNFEKEFYKKLITAVNNRAYIQTQINLASIIEKKEGFYQNELFRNIDFGLFDKETLKIIVLIELNDGTHKTSSRYKRDLKVREIVKDANIPLITLYSSYENTVKYIERRINEFLK